MKRTSECFNFVQTEVERSDDGEAGVSVDGPNGFLCLDGRIRLKHSQRIVCSNSFGVL